MKKLTATANGTTTTLIDKLRGAVGNNSMENRIGWVASGTSANLYQMVRVTGNTRSTFTVAFADTALPSATATGDVIEFWNERGQGYFPDDVNSELNAGIATVAGKVTDVAIDESQTFDATAPYLDIPATWEFFGGLWYQVLNDPNDSTQGYVWEEIPCTEFHVDIDQYNRTVAIKGQAAYAADGNVIRLIGDIAATPLTVDTQSTSVDPEWLTAYVAYRLLFGAMRRAAKGDDDIATRMAFCKSTEEKTRGQARNRPYGIARKLY